MGQSATKPVTFHKTHGEDIELGDDSAAVRVENTSTSLSTGSIFTAEPIKINQKIYIKLLVVARKSHDVVSVGFTTKTPTEMGEITEDTDTWIFSLSKYFCIEEAIVCFFVDQTGTINYSRGNTTQIFKVLNKKVDVRKPLWAVFYIWNEPTTIKLLSQNEVRQNVFRMQDDAEMHVQNEDFNSRRITRDFGAVTDVSQNDDNNCIICCVENLEVVFVPCGHFCTCLQCGQWVRNKDNLCPICRNKIGSVVKVYKS